jgi:hypothetical protein
MWRALAVGLIVACTCLFSRSANARQWQEEWPADMPRPVAEPSEPQGLLVGLEALTKVLGFDGLEFSSDEAAANQSGALVGLAGLVRLGYVVRPWRLFWRAGAGKFLSNPSLSAVSSEARAMQGEGGVLLHVSGGAGWTIPAGPVELVMEHELGFSSASVDRPGDQPSLMSFLFEPTVRFGLRTCSRDGACLESTLGAAPAYSSTGDVGFSGTLVLSANMDFSLQQVRR